MAAETFSKIMGIVNVTPDSFSDGGLHYSPQAAIEHALGLVRDGADILDIGGESSRPGAMPISAQEECDRVLPVIEGLKAAGCSLPISIDTVKYEVASKAIQAGASMINDVSGLMHDVLLARLAAEKKVPLIIMHSQGSPATMQNNPQYKNVVKDVLAELKGKVAIARSFGAKDIILDIGIGFGKTAEHNWQLLHALPSFQSLGYPLLLGISRKAFLGSTLNIEKPADRDTATALLHALLLDSGMSIIRVHNVAMLNQLRILKQRLQQG
jgi:dihydropteroate synthase